jgi:hypothetical protein
VTCGKPARLNRISSPSGKTPTPTPPSWNKPRRNTRSCNSRKKSCLDTKQWQNAMAFSSRNLSVCSKEEEAWILRMRRG